MYESIPDPVDTFVMWCIALGFALILILGILLAIDSVCYDKPTQTTTTTQLKAGN